MKRHGAETPSIDNQLDRLLNTISISPSEMSAGIQPADVCSRSIWSHFENSKSHRYEQLQPFFDSNGGKVYEPFVVPERRIWV